MRLIGANAAAIAKGEDRQLFKEAMLKIGLDMARSGVAHKLEEAREVAAEIGSFPLIIRPAFTLGGAGGGIAYNREEFETIVARGLDLSPVSEVLVEESLLGWKEFEMEVMRDRADNCVIICSIENFDPMGVHTGDSITVAPAQTLTDREFQVMRDASFAVIREIGVETGGSNIQFAVNPENGRMIVIEMNPRVSRSSALASKATGFPIAKIAAKLAVGYTLDEVQNDITRETPASFEPTHRLLVVKMPRFTFEKFPQADPDAHHADEERGRGDGHRAHVQGGAAKGAPLAGNRALRPRRRTARLLPAKLPDGAWDRNRSSSTARGAECRADFLSAATRSWRAYTLEEIFELTKIDRWFLHNIRQLVGRGRQAYRAEPGASIPPAAARRSSASPTGSSRSLTGARPRRKSAPQRKAAGIMPTYRLVDTCAAEFEAYTPYYYSTYGDENETPRRRQEEGHHPRRRPEPHRAGHRVRLLLRPRGLRAEGGRLRDHHGQLEPGDGLDRLRHQRQALLRAADARRRAQYLRAGDSRWGVIVQFGGQTPLNLARGLAGERRATSSAPRRRASRSPRTASSSPRCWTSSGCCQTPSGTATNEDGGRRGRRRASATRCWCGPSFVLGGRAMELVYNEDDLRRYIRNAVEASPERPVLVDRFLEDATEVDVDCICRRRDRGHRRDHGAHRAGRASTAATARA